MIRMIANSVTLDAAQGDEQPRTISGIAVPYGVDAVVESVDVGGAAMRAGILPGDVITGVEGTKVVDGGNIMAEVRNKKPGESIEVEVYREGVTLTLPTVLGFGQAIIIEP